MPRSYPNRLVSLIVTVSQGGWRLTQLARRWQSLSRSGASRYRRDRGACAGGNVGAYQAANAPTKRYTLHARRCYMSINPALLSDLRLQPFTDLAAAVSRSRSFPNIMMGPIIRRPIGSRIHRLRQGQRGRVTFESDRFLGASPAYERRLAFKSMAGPREDSRAVSGRRRPARNDLLPGRVSVMFSNCRAFMPQVKARRSRASITSTGA